MPYPTPSFWERTRYDFIIVGGGFTGLQAALASRRRYPRASILVLERHPVALGASTRNAGFACFGAPTELLADVREQGWEATLQTVAARFRGVEALRTTWAGEDIGWREQGGYEIISDAATAAYVRDHLTELNRRLYSITGRRETWAIVPPPRGAPRGELLLYNDLEAQLQPAALHRALRRRCAAANVDVWNGVTVTDVLGESPEEFAVHSEELAPLTSASVVICTNAFLPRLLPRYAGAVRPVRNQVFVTRPLRDLQLRGCYHYHEGYVYLRDVNNTRLLIGGGRHRAGPESETDAFGNTKTIRDYLLGWVDKHLPELNLTAADFEHSWSGILAQGASKEVLLEEVRPGLVVAGRLAGMGVALSAEVGSRVAGLLYP